MKEELKKIRSNLYGVNAINVSLHMIALKERDDKIVFDTNACLGEIIKQIDALLAGLKKDDT